MESTMNRRTFIGAAGAAAAGIAAVGALANGSVLTAQADEYALPEVVEEKDCDICIVGAGSSGLAACVEAAELGASVICLESQSIAGGNGNGVEGIFGYGSDYYNEVWGVEYDTSELIREELDTSQYRALGPAWVDLYANFGENVNWLMDIGCTFEGIDNGLGAGMTDSGVVAFHRWEEDAGAVGYTPAMTAKAEELGVDIELNTKAHTLAKDDSGKVTGVYADNADGTILVNAKAVIVATGGVMQNEELLHQLATNPGIAYAGFDGHDGSGHMMCENAGARNNVPNAAIQYLFQVPGTPDFLVGGMLNMFLMNSAPYCVWINENAERFVNEDCAINSPMAATMPCLFQKKTFVLMDQPMMDTYTSLVPDVISDNVETGIEYGSIFKADTIEELAQAADLDVATLTDTVDTYNGFVANGKDENYAKDPADLVALSTAPYYALSIEGFMVTIMGSICTNRNHMAVDDNMDPIEGLYVVGVEGSMLWCNLYNMSIPGTCNGNNVNSGRAAAQHAYENYVK